MTAEPQKVHQAYVDGLKSIAEEIKSKIAILIKHHGEKGRVVEGIVTDIFHKILPKRFSIGTGFIITKDGEYSSQLDIVIFDNHYNAPVPISRSISLFPVECVYATVEVKSKLDKTELIKSLKTIKQIRGFKGKKYYRPNEQVRLAPRSYIFSFETNKFPQGYPDFEAWINKNVTEIDTHVHGILVLERDWCIEQIAYKRPFEFRTTGSSGTQAFFKSFLLGIDTMPMAPANMENYLGKDIAREQPDESKG